MDKKEINEKDLSKVSGGYWGSTSYIDSYLCIGCENCLNVCPMGAIRLENGKCVINAEECINCGVCSGECPTGAINLG